MENTVRFSITVLEEERVVVGSDFTDEEKTKFIESLKAKYGGKIELIETRVLTPLLKKRRPMPPPQGSHPINRRPAACGRHKQAN